MQITIKMEKKTNCKFIAILMKQYKEAQLHTTIHIVYEHIHNILIKQLTTNKSKWNNK